MLRWRIIATLGVAVIASATFWPMAVGSPGKSNQPGDRRCGDCHNCDVPSISDTCLRSGAGASPNAFQHESHSLKEAPDSLVLASLAEKYAPVCFDHKAHAEMSEMGSGCTTCHHYSPAGEIPPCQKCHKQSSEASESKALSLETAYHSQCRACHQDWGNNATCTPCHRTDGTVHSAVNSTTDASSKPARGSMPLVIVPVSRVYKTSLRGSFVTFQHVEHIELFQLECSRCHQQERCSHCHAVCATGANVSETRDVRVTCICCHEKARLAADKRQCIGCHNAEPQPPLFHQIVGKSIPECLGKATCQSCHEKRA